MLKVGLTGNLGSGKTTISRIFQILGVPVYHADDASKNFFSDSNVRQLIRNEFGQEVFSEQNEIDRKALGKIVFSDPEKLKKLNSILHPLVREDFRNWSISYQNHPYVIQEAAILFESGFCHEYDLIVHVSCPEEIAVERALRRDQADRDDIMKRTRLQWTDDKKAAMSDFIILKDGSELVIPQVLKNHRLLMNLSLPD
jgi:dephospho-CoA kinase